jgi:hypothetical protein
VTTTTTTTRSPPTPPSKHEDPEARAIRIIIDQLARFKMQPRRRVLGYIMARAQAMPEGDLGDIDLQDSLFEQPPRMPSLKGAQNHEADAE